MRSNIHNTLPFGSYRLNKYGITSYTFKEVCKILRIPKIGRNKLVDFLKWKEILDKDRTPDVKYLSNGYFELHTITHKGLSIHLTKITSTGIEFIRELITADFEEYLVYRKAKYQRYKEGREARQKASAQLMQ